MGLKISRRGLEWEPRAKALTITPSVRRLLEEGVQLSGDSTVPLWSGRAVSYGDLYRKQPSVRTAVDFLARSMAQVRLRVIESVGDGRFPRPDHRAQSVLDHPYASSRSRFWRSHISSLLVYDQAFALKVRADDRLAIAHVPIDRVSIRQSDIFGPSGFVIQGSSSQLVVPLEDAVYVHGWHPSSNSTGVSPMETLRATLAEEAAATKNRELLWRNGARIPSYIERDIAAPMMSPEDLAAWRTELDAAWRGERGAYRMPLMPPGYQIKPAGWDPESTEYLESRRLTREEVAHALGIDPRVIGYRDANYASADAARTALYTETLGPLATWIQEEWEEQFLYVDFEDRDSGFALEFDLREKMKGSFLEQLAAGAAAVGGPWMTVNRWRSIMNEPPLEGPNGEGVDDPRNPYNQVIRPLNVTLGGQPNPRAPENQSDAIPVPAAKADVPALQAKARIDLEEERATRTRLARRHEDVYSRWYERIRRTARAAKSNWVLDVPRWQRELYEDLRPLATATAVAAGTRAASRIRGSFDADRIERYLDTRTDAVATAVTTDLATQIERAPDLDGLFDELLAGAAALGATATTGLWSWGVVEAAHQNPSPGRMKQWIGSGLPRSRHIGVDGEVVGMSELFSNGLRWPGDSTGPAEEAVNCMCSLDLIEGE